MWNFQKACRQRPRLVSVNTVMTVVHIIYLDEQNCALPETCLWQTEPQALLQTVSRVKLREHSWSALRTSSKTSLSEHLRPEQLLWTVRSVRWPGRIPVLSDINLSQLHLLCTILITSLSAGTELPVILLTSDIQTFLLKISFYIFISNYNCHIKSIIC